MNRIREKFSIPKTQSLFEHSSSGSLETMVRDSFYLAWPIASGSDTHEKKRGCLKKSQAVDEDDDDDRSVIIFYLQHHCHRPFNILYTQPAH